MDHDAGGVEIGRGAGVNARVGQPGGGDEEVADGGGALLYDHGHSPTAAAVADALREGDTPFGRSS